MTDRRRFLACTAGMVLATPGFAFAQAAGPVRIGFLGNGGAPTAPGSLQSFTRRLGELGWTDGRNLSFEYRWANGDLDRLPQLAAELAQAKVDLIVVSGPIAIRAAQKATPTIPIVFVVLIDPVTMGIVPSLARPGGNATGLASHFEELITKQLQLLKEAVPGLSRVALFRQVDSAPPLLTAAQGAAQSLGLQVVTVEAKGVADYANAFKAARRERAGALHVLPSPQLNVHRGTLIGLAAEYRLPACYELRSFVQDGGLMSYGPNIDDMFARAADYADRILRGAKPGDLAIERPARFDLVINLRTAAALGLAIPPSLLQRADVLIQ